jgi:small subunit ribosomal protein S20
LPNIKSSIKRVKINKKKNLRNRMVKSSVKTEVKKFNAVLAADPSSAASELRVVTSTIDKAASKGVFHKNTADRRKSRLAKALNRATV